MSRKWAYALGQLGWSLGSYGVLNLINYFYNPPVENGSRLFPLFIASAAALGIVASAGRLFDAITDPLIAGWSDRSTHPKGRRISFLRRSAIPFIVLSILVFTPPFANGAANTAWLFVTTFLFYFFMTMYVTPYFALMSELGHSPNERLQLSTMISITWALGFMVGSQVYAVQQLLQRWFSATQAFQLTLVLFGVISLVFMSLPVLFVDEKRYCEHHRSEEGSFQAVRTALTNRDFRVFVLSDLSYWLALTFVQTGISYYVVLLLGLPKGQASLFLLVMFVASFVYYVPVGLIAAKVGKKPLLTAAFILFVLSAALMSGWGLFPIDPMVHGIAVMVLSALPIAIFGILPNAIVADIAEDDGIRTGNHKAAVFFGARTLMQKVGVAITLLVFPILSRIDAGGVPTGTAGEAAGAAASVGRSAASATSASDAVQGAGAIAETVTVAGVRTTLFVAMVGLVIGLVLFRRYNEAGVLQRLKAAEPATQEETGPAR